MSIEIVNKNTLKFNFNITYETFVNLMTDKKYILKFIKILQEIPFEYYVLQTPCFQKNNLFEFVIINKPELKKMKLNTTVYKKYFNNNKVTSFLNLTGDTTLIVPQILSNVDKNIYLNISTFSKNAPINQQILLWKKVIDEIKKCKHKCFLSTHGLGIGWLHIRIDESPKYYLYDNYKGC